MGHVGIATVSSTKCDAISPIRIEAIRESSRLQSFVQGDAGDNRGLPGGIGVDALVKLNISLRSDRA